MAKRKPAKKPAPRRISPLKPGLSGARNWATAQVRGAAYSRKRMTRLIISAVFLLMAILWMALWLGGFFPAIKASGDRFAKERLMSMGFVVKHVDVVGEGRISETQVRAVLGVYSGDYLFDMDIDNAQTRVQNLSWVDTAVIRRLWPNRIVVHVNERRPYALWQENGRIQIIDNSGVVIQDANVNEFANLPFVVGAGASQQAEAFLKILARYPEIYAQTESCVYISKRRWDIVLKNDGLRILLPADNPERALALLVKYNAKHGMLRLDLESIDLRIKGRLALRPAVESRVKAVSIRRVGKRA